MNDEELWKIGAALYAEYYRDVRQQLSDEFASNVRWLTASLFALNAGGLGTLAARNPPTSMQQCAGLAFWTGILLAFSLVAYSQNRTNKFIKAIQEIENYWVNVTVTGQTNEEKINEIEQRKNGVSSKLAPLLAVGSFLMFTVALLLASKP